MLLYDVPLNMLWRLKRLAVRLDMLGVRSIVKVFSRKISQFVVPGFFFLGLGTIEASHYYTVGSVCICIAGLWSIGWWLTDKRLRHNISRKKASEDEISGQRRKKVIVTLLLLVLVFGYLVRADRLRTHYILDQLEGRLFPASDPMPSNNCGTVPEDAVILFEGREVAHVVTKFPHRILSVRGHDAIVIDRSSDKTINVLLNVKSADNKVIVLFDERGFVINQNNYLRKERPDRSTLRVEDQYGEWVLKARYLNSRAFQISGKLRYPDLDRQITIPVHSLHGVCVGSGFGADIEVN